MSFLRPTKHVAVCCSVLQCVAVQLILVEAVQCHSCVLLSMLQCVAVRLILVKAMQCPSAPC